MNHNESQECYHSVTVNIWFLRKPRILTNNVDINKMQADTPEVTKNTFEVDTRGIACMNEMDINTVINVVNTSYLLKM